MIWSPAADDFSDCKVHIKMRLTGSLASQFYGEPNIPTIRGLLRLKYTDGREIYSCPEIL